MYFLARKIIEIYIKTRYRTNIIGKENIPADSVKGGFIIACNHQRYADPPAVAALMRGKFSFMAKSELFKNKFFAFLIRKCGAFPVERGSGGEAAIDKGIQDIKNGRIFVIFPEGTRSKDGRIARGRTGVSLIASMADVPVLPVCIMYGLKGKKNRLDFAVGKMIPAEELRISSTNDRRELKRVTNLIMDNIKQLQQEIFDKTGTVLLTAGSEDNIEDSEKNNDN